MLIYRFEMFNRGEFKEITPRQIVNSDESQIQRKSEKTK